MTIRMPQANIFDRFLRLIGKKRGVIFPSGALGQPGLDVYARAWKENFWTALLRPARQPLPDGTVDLFQFEDFRKDIAEGR
jgi:hypothetical protein